MKQISAAMFLTAALSLGVSAFAQTTPTNPTGQVDQPTGQAAPQKPADLKDVPAGHWAQEAIKIAADCGIIRGYPDGTFRGNQPITRYEAAAIVARLIAAVKSGACGIGTAGTSGFSITEAQYNDLMSAVQELQADLAQLGVRVAELEDNAVTQDDLARVEELATQARDIAEQAATTADDAAAAAADAADAAAAAQDAADAAQAAADENADAIQAAQDAADAAQAAADDAQAAVDALQVTDGTVTIDLGTLATTDDVQGLQDQIDALQAAIDEMPATEAFDPTELQGQVDDLSGAVDDLQSQIDDLNAQIADMGAGTGTDTGAEPFDPTDLQDQIDDLQAQIADTQDQISALTDMVTAQQDTLDGLVDSTAGLQDDVGTLQDVTADLQAQIDALGGDTQGAQDLMDAIDAASIAADTALAQSRELQDKVDELDGRVTDLESGLGELGATVESQADSIAALNDLVVLLNQDVLSLQDRVTQLERQVDELTNTPPPENNYASADDVTALQDDLDSLREFTTLLRRDQTALSDTVGDLEARVGALETKVDTGLAALDKRVTTLENNGFKITGEIDFNYYTSRVWDPAVKGIGNNFDIDRLGIPTQFSGGAVRDAKIDSDSPTDYGDFNASGSMSALSTLDNIYDIDGGGAALTGEKVDATNTAPTRPYYEGAIQPNITLKFSFKAPFVEASNGYNAFSMNLSLNLAVGSPYTNVNGSVAGHGDTVTTGFTIKGLQSTFKIGGAPLFFNYGINASFKFTNYGFNNPDGRGDGFVASLDGSSLLPLNPTLTVVYMSKGGLNADNLYDLGLYGTLSLIPGLTGGVYWGYEGTDVLANQAYQNTAFGLNFGGKVFGFLDLSGEYNNQKATGQANSQVATYVKVGLALDPFSFAANYRYIDGSFTPIGNNEDPYKKNQKGFGVNLDAKNLLGFLTFGAYFDSVSRVDQTIILANTGDFSNSLATNARTKFGVSLGLRLIGFDIKASLDRINEVDNTGNTNTGVTYDKTAVALTLAHDGSKSDALIGGLNLALGYKVTTTNWVAATTLYAYADTAISLGSIRIAPAAWFNTTTTNPGASTVTDLGGKIAIDTPFLFGSKLSLAGALDNTTRAPGLNSSTTWIKASLGFDSFLFPNSRFSVAFATRTDVNRDGRKFGPSFGSPTGTWGDVTAAAQSQTETGLYLEFGYYGLSFAYGIFQLNNNLTNAVRYGQAFAIDYAIKF